jgi:hypothetical protein
MTDAELKTMLSFFEQYVQENTQYNTRLCSLEEGFGRIEKSIKATESLANSLNTTLSRQLEVLTKKMKKAADGANEADKELRSKLKALEEQIHKTSDSSGSAFKEIKASYEKEIAGLRQELAELRKLAPQRTDLEKRIMFLEKKSLCAPGNSVIDEFNTWAAHASSAPALPEGFWYLEGMVRLATKRPITYSKTPTPWLSNIHGLHRYLFPNPLLLGPETAPDVKALYKFNEEALKAQGQNNIKVFSACEMNEEGWIGYKGGFTILP